MAQWLKQRYLKSPPHLQHHCCLIVYGFLQSLIFGYLWNDFQSSWKKIQKPSKFKNWVGLPSNSNQLCIKLFHVGFWSSADCENIPSSHPREDSQRFYLFKILRAHILPLTNCAFNKPGAQKDHQVPGPEKKLTLGVIKRGLLDNPRTRWRFREVSSWKNYPEIQELPLLCLTTGRYSWHRWVITVLGGWCIHLDDSANGLCAGQESHFLSSIANMLTLRLGFRC